MSQEPGATCKHCGMVLNEVIRLGRPRNLPSNSYHYRCGSWIVIYPESRPPDDHQERQSDRCRIQQLINELAFQRQRAYMRNDIVSADRISKLIGAKLPSVHEGEG
jgi:hypothetical protein